MTRRRDADCPLDLCDGTGWVDVTDWADPGQTPCPCGRAIPEVEPPADLHDRIMGAIRVELRASRPVDAIHDYHNREGERL